MKLNPIIALALLLIFQLSLIGTAIAEVKCESTDSSFLHQACFDEESKTLTLLIKSNYYTYCDVPFYVFENLISASSKGRFYNRYIKGNYQC